jgi:hypothetical protein
MRASFLAAFVALFAWLGVAPAHCQVVGGTVRDTAGAPVPLAMVVASQGAEDVRATLTDSLGNFNLPLPAAGNYEIRVVSLGYTGDRRQVQLVAGSRVVVQLAVSEDAIELDAITVRASGRIPAQATIEGLYARHAVAPRVGTSRVFVRGDPELSSSSTVATLLDQRLQISPVAQRRCVVYFVNGVVQHHLTVPSEFVRGFATSALEGVEYYRDHLTAPLGYQGQGCWNAPVYSIIAIWYHR